MRIIAILLMLIITSCLVATEKQSLTVFYKQRKPSLQVKAKLDSLLINYQDKYDITYYDIEDSANLEVITNHGLPATHFPFAIVINDRYTAKIDNKLVSFMHFPKFMEGIGRHEGSWSMDQLKQVLDNNELLYKENILPVLDEAKDEPSSCED